MSTCFLLLRVFYDCIVLKVLYDSFFPFHVLPQTHILSQMSLPFPLFTKNENKSFTLSTFLFRFDYLYQWVLPPYPPSSFVSSFFCLNLRFEDVKLYVKSETLTHTRNIFFIHFFLLVVLFTWIHNSSLTPRLPDVLTTGPWGTISSTNRTVRVVNMTGCQSGGWVPFPARFFMQ